MQMRVARLIRKLANAQGVTIARQVPVEEQRSLIRSMMPVTTEHPLIRIGGDEDGGYLVPDDLTDIAACFSPGVDTMASFEEGMVARGIPCFQIDASVTRSPLEGHPLVTFERKFLGIAPDATTITLDQWVAEKVPVVAGDLILQMDIEGAEWLVLAGATDAVLARFRVILVEFHDVDRLVDPFGFGIISEVFRKLLRQFDVVHVHPNNNRPIVLTGAEFAVPGVLEYTFLRKDRSCQRLAVAQLPHPLDRDNTDALPSIALDRSLYHPDAG